MNIPSRYQKMYKGAIGHTISPNKAIHCHCIECYGWSLSEAKKCKNIRCPLYAYSPAAKAARERQTASEGEIKSSDTATDLDLHNRTADNGKIL